jgi:hypothetical protein
MDQTAPKFDTARYEEELLEGGVEGRAVKAHPAALLLVVDSATKTLLDQKDLNVSELRLEARMEKIANDLTWKILGGVAIVNALMIAIVKLT